MSGFDFGAVFSGVAQGLLGGGRRRPPPGPMEPFVPPPPAPDPVVPPAPPPARLEQGLRSQGRGFAADLIRDMGQTAKQAALGGVNAYLQGKAEQVYNDAAFPGTTPWEQLGASSGQGAEAYSDVAIKMEELEQRKYEADLASHTQLQAARIGVGERLAGVFLQGGGDPEVAARILRETGALPPGEPFDPQMMVRGRLESEIALNDARRYTEDELRDPRRDDLEAGALLKDNQSENVNMDTVLKPFEFYLKDWTARSSQFGLTWDKVVPILGEVKVSLQGRYRNAGAEDVNMELYKTLERRFGKAVADNWLEFFRDAP